MTAAPSAVSVAAPNHARRLGIALAASGAVLFSAKAILAKLQYRYGVDSLDVLTLRMALSLPLFVLLGIRETRRARQRQALPSRRDLGLILVLGVLGYYLSSLLDFWGLEYVPVSLERLILFLNPTIVLLIGLFAYRRKVAAKEWIALAVSYAGVVLVMVENLRVQGEHVLFGSALVLGAAVSYALYLAMSGELVKRMGSLQLVAYAMVVSTAATLIHYLIARDPGGLLGLPWQVYGLATANAVFCTFLPVTFTMAAVARLGAGTAAQFSVIGPVSLVFLGAWVLGETITAIQLVGTAVVLGGVVLLSRPGANSVPVAPPDNK
ncbi:triose-phosphate Transporter family protein [Lysobacter antibioticus]|uniref:EamA-like transporter family protein n=1 Tax=Lysobacter antibioticus TaxID=84531 RepID=A0A0S2FIB3_LYSAN|nr:DMT family transporter [Lysobacter antibioticus]ALN61158.1 triose-phosphate Transporter family protein [Lysobacter antibioticus]ALN83275.1 eamA-like transporter family protein [Lysobacter antibioticus]